MRKLILFPILFLPFTLYPLPSTAHASGLSISPPIIEIKAEPGNDIKKDFQIINNAARLVNLEIQFIPFDQNGKLLNIDLPIKPWVAVYQQKLNSFCCEAGGEDTTALAVELHKESAVPIKELTLRSKEASNLTLNIQVPAGADEADYYFLIAFVTKDKSSALAISESQLTAYSNIRAGISTNVLLSVTRGVDSQNPAGFIAIDELTSPKFVEQGPVELKVKLRNDNNHFVKAEGALIIANMFGQKVASIPLGMQNILAQTDRTTDIVFTDNFLLGPYSAELEINNSKTGRQFMFFALPIKKALIVLAIIFILIILKQKLALRFRT